MCYVQDLINKVDKSPVEKQLVHDYIEGYRKANRARYAIEKRAIQRAKDRQLILGR